MNIEYIAERLELKRMGAQFSGPCPVCGGDDRFHVKRGKTHDVLYHCRQGCQFIEIVKELQDRGIIENDFKPDPNFVSNEQKSQLVNDRLYITMYENQYKGSRPSLKDWKRYKLALARKANIEDKLGITPKPQYIT